MEKNLKKKELEAVRYIRNFLLHNGRFPSLREMMKALNYKSSRSSAVIIEKLIAKNVLTSKKSGKGLILTKPIRENLYETSTVDLPLVGSVTCGMPVMAEENIEAMIPVSTKLAAGNYKYFLLRASGDSMDKVGINDGDVVLVRQQSTAKNKDIVVALIDGETTLKEINISNDVIVLKPQSTNADHTPIIVTNDFRVQGVVVTTIPDF